MAKTQANPASLLASSFLAGCVGAYVYNQYLVRVNSDRRSSRRASSSSRISDPIAALLSSNDIGIRVFNHLARVYATLGGTVLMAVLGSLVQMRTKTSTGIAELISLGFAVSLMFKAELWKLLGLGFFNGMSLGNIVQYALALNSAIVPTALASTTAVFASFAAAATLTSRRSLLYLYGALGSALGVITLTSLANTYFLNAKVFSFNLYAGLAMFVGYVLADSQLIIERADQGDEDYVSHAWLLFTDLSGIFTRLLVILIKQDQDRKKKSRRGGKRDEEDED